MTSATEVSQILRDIFHLYISDLSIRILPLLLRPFTSIDIFPGTPGRVREKRTQGRERTSVHGRIKDPRIRITMWPAVKSQA
jgi:hypothetical protein